MIADILYLWMDDRISRSFSWQRWTIISATSVNIYWQHWHRVAFHVWKMIETIDFRMNTKRLELIQFVTNSYCPSQRPFWDQKKKRKKYQDRRFHVSDWQHFLMGVSQFITNSVITWGSLKLLNFFAFLITSDLTSTPAHSMIIRGFITGM